MEAEGLSAEPFELEQLRRGIEQWRQGRPKLRQMPIHLWNEATSVARKLGIYRVSRALRLNYDALKQRVAPTSQRGRGARRVACTEQRTSRGDFIELSGVPMLSGGPSDGAVVEVVASDGTRLTIRLKDGSPDVAALINAFRERR